MTRLTVLLYPSLLRHAALILAGQPAAIFLQPADLLHMAVERLCRHPPGTISEHPVQFTSLIRTVMQRTLIDMLRRQSAARRPDLCCAATLEAAVNIPAPCSAAAGIMVCDAIAILELREPAAARLIRLHYLEGCTGAELAVRFGVSASCISRRLTAALEALRKIFELERPASRRRRHRRNPAGLPA